MGALASNPNAWLEVSVDGSPLLPRQRLVAVPFANVAGTIQGENLSVDPVTGDVHVKNKIVFGEGSKQSSFGEWETKTKNVVYQAESDGFVMMTVGSSSTSKFWFRMSDSSSPATFAYINTDGSYMRGTQIIPVKKGKYWQVNTTGTMTVKWMPVGL